MNARIALGLICGLAALGCLEGIAWLIHRVEPGTGRFLQVGLLSQAVWVLLALAGALLATAAPVRERLGLVSSALSLPATLLLVAGFATFSHGLYLMVGALELRQSGALAELESGVARASRHGPSLLLVVLAFGLAPGLGEELLFRGLIQRALRRRTGPAASVGIAAALFAVAHGDPVHGAAAFGLGLYLGTVAHLAGSTWPAMAAHVLNNALAVAAHAADRGLDLPPGLTPAWVMLGIGAAPAVGVAWWDRRRAAGAPGGARAPDQAGGADRRLRDVSPPP